MLERIQVLAGKIINEQTLMVNQKRAGRRGGKMSAGDLPGHESKCKYCSIQERKRGEKKSDCVIQPLVE